MNPRTGRSPLEGGVVPRARRSLLEGAFVWATPVGHGGTPRCGPCFVRVFKWEVFRFGFLQVLSRIPLVVLGDLRVVPDSSPEHLRVCRPGSRRCCSLLIGHPSPLVANAFRGAASADPRV
jgi:hypothetical protein